MDNPKILEIKNSLYTSLSELSLSAAEIDLYAASLFLGPSPISKLASELKTSRPNLYKLIADLESKGLAKFSEKGKYARTFLVEPPTVIIDKIRDKKEGLDNVDKSITHLLPNLLTIYQQGGRETRVKVIQGKDQYLKIFSSIIDEASEEMRFFGSAHDFIGFISWQEEKEWIKKRIRKNIKIKSLILPSEDALTLKAADTEQLRETRIIKTDPSFTTSFQLFANKIVLWQPQTPIAVVIDDQHLAAMFKTIFELLWDASK